MRKLCYLFSLLCFLLGWNPAATAAKPEAWQLGINQTQIDLSGNPVVVGQIAATFAQPGTVIVTFDGTCISSPGDRIVLAASDQPDWSPNDGNTSVEAFDDDRNRNPFSHTRAYSVGAGSYDFYAVAQNYVETDGNGIASIYGSLSVKFFPDQVLAGEARPEAFFQGISQTNIDLEGSAVVVGEISFEAPQSGRVVVRFDGKCIASLGDRIVLAASDHAGWTPNDGNVGIEASSDDVNRKSFAHSRSYLVGPGNHTFYAVAQNYVETDGSGIASIYGGLTVEYYPDLAGIYAFSAQEAISETNIEVLGAPVTVASTQLNLPEAGTVLLRFDGEIISSPGDRIVAAAADTPDWSPNDGNVSMEAFSSDVNQNSFSHTRAYAVGPGLHTFYAVVESYVETDGSGMASVYGSFTVEFFPETTTATNELTDLSPSLKVFPNPTEGICTVRIGTPLTEPVKVEVINTDGRIMQSLGWKDPLEMSDLRIDLTNYPAGAYFLRLSGKSTTGAQVLVKR